MTLEELKALSDREIEQVIAWGQAELRQRVERRKQETIAKIKELAGSVGVRVAIGGVKGRPARTKKEIKREKAAR